MALSKQNDAEFFVRVTEVLEDRGDVRIFELRAPDGGELPPFSAGAHIDLHAKPDLVRQYSLLNDPQECHRYVIAIAMEPESRGGSRYFHEEVEAGDLLRISTPRCHFILKEDAPHSILIAGGIGITPIWCMAQRLSHLGRGFELHYVVRGRATAPLLDRMEITPMGEMARIATYFSRDPGGSRPDIETIVRNVPAGTQIYCCGPGGLLDTLKAATAHLPPETVHYEQFTAVAPVAAEGGFSVELARTGKTLEVKPGQTVLDAIREAGIKTTSSCREGICGSCETVVLSGTPDHRDAVLTDAEKAEGKTMMICCSGAHSPKLVLDL
ncbi:oxidoreductase [Novosphingobium endophyticum]|uniref:Oxidoreductase n=1 Tax=Novosphingobium endophyticum TaxID=1955250 RepID=A0A916TYE1_9SPHN|nr:PDR/VanB family oxidoreductase [Novosphingobium endophyticum]GGC15659.1 oxidoreductase [Novosphingobium endophyticum]